MINSTYQKNKRIRHASQPFIIVGCIVSNKDGKILLIQEDDKWNQPAGWLELNESIIDGAKREAQEETGQEIVIKSLLGVYSLVKQKGGSILHAVKFIFRAHSTGKKLSSSEKINTQWFSPEEINKLEGKLWDPDVIKEIKDWQAGKSYSLEIVKAFTNA